MAQPCTSSAGFLVGENGRFLDNIFCDSKGEINMNLNGYSEAFAVGTAMERYGGRGFYGHLGKALQQADKANIEKIREAWPKAWSEHLEMALRMPQFARRD